MLQDYRTHVAERAALGIPPLPLSAGQTADLIELLKNPQPLGTLGEEAVLLDLITHRVPAGVDDAAKVKASYLAAIAHGGERCMLISREKATELLGSMLGGYNIGPLVDLLDDEVVAAVAAEEAKHRSGIIRSRAAGAGHGIRETQTAICANLPLIGRQAAGGGHGEVCG